MHFCLNKQRHKTEKQPDKVMAFQEAAADMV